MSELAGTEMADPFGAARQEFEGIVSFLTADEAMALEHGELEDDLDQRGRELLRRMFQDHLTLRARDEVRLEAVVNADGAVHRAVEAGHRRGLETIFGALDVERLAYRQKGKGNLHPADASLNLPEERHSHGLRRLSAIEASRGSFEEAAQAIERRTGHRVAKRQVELLTTRSAAHVDDFYETRSGPRCAPGDVLVVSVDGKGIVMRPDALREATRRAAQTSATKLTSRLSRGEKHGRKRMAELGAVYAVTPVPRRAADVFSSPDDEVVEGPVATDKWLTASVVDEAASVIAAVFDEADRRDPDHERPRVALVDGNSHQIDRIWAEASQRQVNVTVLIDLVHVLEYLWKAAWCFFSEGDPVAEQWVRDRGLRVLDGGARDVAAGIRRRASGERLSSTARKNADACATYLTNKADYLDYPTALASGWPIATGIIEGACRHIVKDRMDLTGARWSLDGAEAVLKLRALRSNGDFDDYWRFHLEREHRRVHRSRYADSVLPAAA